MLPALFIDSPPKFGRCDIIRHKYRSSSLCTLFSSLLLFFCLLLLFPPLPPLPTLPDHHSPFTMKNYHTLLCASLAFATISHVVSYPLQETPRSISSQRSLSVPFQQKPGLPKNRLRKRQDTNPNDDQSILGNENDVRYIASIVIAGEPLDVSFRHLARLLFPQCSPCFVL